jgi:hypothetical protein
MKRLFSFLFPLFSFLFLSCTYDETMDTCHVTVQLVYPEGSISPYAGALVELKDANASIFISPTDNSGCASFQVPAGIYESSSSTQFIDSLGDTWWRYNFNGVRSMIIVSHERLQVGDGTSGISSNVVPLTLTMSKKRIVH